MRENYYDGQYLTPCKDDELENWFKRADSGKKGWLNEKPFDSVEENLIELQKALKTIQS